MPVLPSGLLTNRPDDADPAIFLLSRSKYPPELIGEAGIVCTGVGVPLEKGVVVSSRIGSFDGSGEAIGRGD